MKVRLLVFADFDNGMLLGGGCAPVAVASMGAGGGATAAVAATPSAEEKKVGSSFCPFLLLPFIISGMLTHLGCWHWI